MKTFAQTIRAMIIATILIAGSKLWLDREIKKYDTREAVDPSFVMIDFDKRIARITGANFTGPVIFRGAADVKVRNTHWDTYGLWTPYMPFHYWENSEKMKVDISNISVTNGYTQDRDVDHTQYRGWFSLGRMWTPSIEITEEQGVAILEGPNTKIDDRGVWNPGARSWCIWLWSVSSNKFLLSTHDGDEQKWHLYDSGKEARSGADRFMIHCKQVYQDEKGGDAQ
jgi:hypothetical protein